jgi:thiamine kinase-like enzyme
MLRLFAQSFPEEMKVDRAAKNLLSLLGSETINILPELNSLIKKKVETTHKEEINTAHERMLIHRRTLKPAAQGQGETPDSFGYVCLSGGYQNSTFRVCLMNHSMFVSRVAGAGSKQFLDRAAERFNNRVAAQLGVSPDWVYNDGNGNQLSIYLKDPQALNPKQNLQHLIGAVKQLKTLHSSPTPFINTINIFNLNSKFKEIIRRENIFLPAEYAAIAEQTEKMQLIFSNLNIPLVPCHNDTYYNNFLLSEGKIWIIDWEFSGNNDAIWDLSFFAKLAQLSEEQTHLLFTTYFGTPDYKTQHAEEYYRFHAYQLLGDEFTFLWAYVQLANKNTAASKEEFNKWGREALQSGLGIVKEPIFNEALAALDSVGQAKSSRMLHSTA